MKILYNCDKCGKFMPDTALYCPNCGAKTPDIEEEVVSRANINRMLLNKVIENVGDEMTPMAILSTNDEDRQILFHIKNDNIDEEVYKLVDEVRNNRKDLTCVVIAHLADLFEPLRSIFNCDIGLYIRSYGKKSAILDITPLEWDGDEYDYADVTIRLNNTLTKAQLEKKDNSFSQSAFDIVYKALLEQ